MIITCINPNKRDMRFLVLIFKCSSHKNSRERRKSVHWFSLALDRNLLTLQTISLRNVSRDCERILLPIPVIHRKVSRPCIKKLNIARHFRPHCLLLGVIIELVLNILYLLWAQQEVLTKYLSTKYLKSLPCFGLTWKKNKTAERSESEVDMFLVKFIWHAAERFQRVEWENQRFCLVLSAKDWNITQR